MNYKDKPKPTLLNPYNVQIKHNWSFSASQVELWNLCKRKFGFKYVDKVKADTKYATRGQDTHKILEDWLIRGIEPDISDRYGALARTGLKHLPLPGEAFIERGFKFVSINGIAYRADLDIEFFDKLINLPVVGDHKTTTDFKWAHTAESLVQNVQAVIYSNISFENWKSERVLLRWVYYKDQKNRPASKKVEALAEREDMLAKLAKIDVVAEEIAKYGLTASCAKDLPKNPLACSAYGGCPYRESHCDVTDSEYLGAIMQQQSIRERLMAAKAKIGDVKASESVQQPSVVQADAEVKNMQQTVAQGVQPQGLTALERMRQKAAEAAKNKTVETPQVATSASTVVSNSSATPVVAKPVGSSLLSRLKKSPDQTQQQSVSGMPENVVDAATQELIKSMSAPEAVQEVNPPEQPRGDEIVDDPDELAAQVAGEKAGQKASSPTAEKKGRGRPAGSATVKPLGDEGYIFGRVFAEVCRESRGDVKMAADCATAAVKAFRAID